MAVKQNYTLAACPIHSTYNMSPVPYLTNSQTERPHGSEQVLRISNSLYCCMYVSGWNTDGCDPCALVLYVSCIVMASPSFFSSSIIQVILSYLSTLCTSYFFYPSLIVCSLLSVPLFICLRVGAWRSVAYGPIRLTPVFDPSRMIEPVCLVDRACVLERSLVKVPNWEENRGSCISALNH